VPATCPPFGTALPARGLREGPAGAPSVQTAPKNDRHLFPLPAPQKTTGTYSGLAERQEIRSKAFAAAHSIVITSRAFLLFYALSFLPFIGAVGALGVLVLLLRVPYEGFRWYARYWKLDDPHPDVQQARRWFKEAMGIWLLGLLAAVIWLWLRSGGGAR
jgi:hypothetical protein